MHTHTCRMTNDRFKSAMHRVYNHTAVDRYSTALFIEVCSRSPCHQCKSQQHSPSNLHNGGVGIPSIVQAQDYTSVY